MKSVWTLREVAVHRSGKSMAFATRVENEKCILYYYVRKGKYCISYIEYLQHHRAFFFNKALKIMVNQLAILLEASGMNDCVIERVPVIQLWQGWHEIIKIFSLLAISFHFYVLWAKDVTQLILWKFFSTANFNLYGHLWIHPTIICQVLRIDLKC